MILQQKAILKQNYQIPFNIMTSKNNSVSSLVIGFMLDKNKKELLN